MKCPFAAEHPACDYEIECTIQSLALDEAEELWLSLNAEIADLQTRIRQLKTYIAHYGLPPG